MTEDEKMESLFKARERIRTCGEGVSPELAEELLYRMDLSAYRLFGYTLQEIEEAVDFAIVRGWKPNDHD